MERTVDTFYAANDYSQSRYLMRIGEVVSNSYDVERHNKKLITISDQFIKIQQEIFVDKESPQIRQIVNNLIYFIKQIMQQNIKMSMFKDSIRSQFNLFNEQEEIFQLRNDSMLCEQLQQGKYVCKRKSKQIRKFQFPDQYQGTSIGELKKQSAICLMHRYNKKLNLIYYCLATGRASVFQLAHNIYSGNSSINVSKDNQYMYFGDNLYLIKTQEIIRQIYSIFTQFSDCSKFFAYCETFDLTIFNLQQREIQLIIKTNFLFIDIGYTEYYRKISLNFIDQNINYEDWKHQVIVDYYYNI